MHKTYHLFHDFTPKDGSKDEANQSIRIVGRENRGSNEPEWTLLGVLLGRIEGTYCLAVMSSVGITFELGAIDHGIDSLSLTLESMNIHHDVGGVFQSVLQLGSKNIVRTSMNGFSGGIVETIIRRVNGSILNPDSFSKVTSSSHFGIMFKVLIESGVGPFFEIFDLFGLHKRCKMDSGVNGCRKDVLDNLPVPRDPNKWPLSGIRVSEGRNLGHDHGSVLQLVGLRDYEEKPVELESKPI